jgi:phospholipid:diacylglycerol acyltransferase
MAMLLRRRHHGAGSERKDALQREDSSVTDVQAEEKAPLKPKIPSRRRPNTYIFVLGILLGLVAAGFFAKSTDLIEFPEFGQLNINGIFDALPATLVQDVKDLMVSLHVASRLCY